MGIVPFALHCVHPGIPTSLMENAEERLPSWYEKSPSDCFCLVKGFASDNDLSQPPLLVLPGCHLHTFVSALQAVARPNAECISPPISSPLKTSDSAWLNDLQNYFHRLVIMTNSNAIRYADRPIRRTSSTLDRSSRMLYRELSPIQSGCSLLASACREDCCETATPHQIAVALVRAHTRCSARACPIERPWATQHSKAQGPVSQVLLIRNLSKPGAATWKVWKRSIWKQGCFELGLVDMAYCVWCIDDSHGKLLNQKAIL